MESGKQLERLVFFSDAVFAIAITLLVLDIHIPDGLSPDEVFGEIVALWPKYLGYVLSFWVIGIYWQAHHRAFGFVRNIDRKLVALNLLFLMSLAFMPFPASVAGEYGGTQAGAIFYASCLTLTGVLMSSVSLYILRNKSLTDSEIDKREIRRGLVRGLSTPIVSLAVIALTFVSPRNAMLGFFLMLVVPRILNSIAERRRPTGSP